MVCHRKRQASGASALTHSEDASASALALCLCINFTKLLAVASVWIDALDYEKVFIVNDDYGLRPV